MHPWPSWNRMAKTGNLETVVSHLKFYYQYSSDFKLRSKWLRATELNMKYSKQNVDVTKLSLH